MNIETGQLVRLTDEERRAAFARGERLVPIEEGDMTLKQRRELRVDLRDTRSTLGRLLHEQRSKYLPHIGAKQRAKMAARASGSNTQGVAVGETRPPAADLPK